MRLISITPFLATAFVAILFMTSCVNTQKAGYFINAADSLLLVKPDSKEALIQKNDILSIYITSLSPEASSLFNLPNAQPSGASTTSGSTGALGGYLVNGEGNVQIPMLGVIHAAGITKKQLKEDITKALLDKKLLVDPIVTIRQLNYEVTVLGEVARPMVINVPNEKISLIKALGMAGDITIYGKKENVLLIRELDGKRQIIRLNLNDGQFLHSPYYHLQPNDVVYVEPNKQKVINANRNPIVLPTILSALSIVAVIITNLTR